MKDETRLIGLPFAVDSVERAASLFIPAYDHASSLFQIQDGFDVGDVSTVLVQTVRLERVLRSIPAHLSIDWVKTDCQGKDFEVLYDSVAVEFDLERIPKAAAFLCH